MAIYKQLSIASGGGIISTSQQAEQVENTATVLIGLGGTGMDCLRTIKTQIYSRLKPDDPNAVNKTYKHIRFLGVDTDESSNGSGEENDDGAKAGATEFVAGSSLYRAPDMAAAVASLRASLERATATPGE